MRRWSPRVRACVRCRSLSFRLTASPGHAMELPDIWRHRLTAFLPMARGIAFAGTGEVWPSLRAIAPLRTDWRSLACRRQDITFERGRPSHPVVASSFLDFRRSSLQMGAVSLSVPDGQAVEIWVEGRWVEAQQLTHDLGRWRGRIGPSASNRLRLLGVMDGGTCGLWTPTAGMRGRSADPGIRIPVVVHDGQWATGHRATGMISGACGRQGAHEQVTQGGGSFGRNRPTVGGVLQVGRTIQRCWLHSSAEDRREGREVRSFGGFSPSQGIMVARS
jgi:hypothetical protein